LSSRCSSVNSRSIMIATTSWSAGREGRPRPARARADAPDRNRKRAARRFAGRTNA
jgi:hypothetical protein